MSHKSKITNTKLDQLLFDYNLAHGYTGRYRLVTIPGSSRGLILEKACGIRWESMTTNYTRLEMVAFLRGAIDAANALYRRLSRGDATIMAECQRRGVSFRNDGVF